MTDAPATARTLSATAQTAIRTTYDSLRTRMPGFTPRRTQQVMVGAVARALGNDRGVAVVEAPTGTGKSLGYLAAAVPVARELGRRVLLSTATVALQSQLVERDIPAFLKATGTKAKVAIAKGRARYACLRNLAELGAGFNQSTIDFGDDEDDIGAASWPRAPRPGEVELMQQLARAADGDWNGDLDNAPRPVPAELRPLVTTTAGGCSGKRCPYVSRCPSMLARKELDTADVIVANHALVLADQMLEDEKGEPGGVILPKLGRCVVVVDEAHRLAEYAIDAGASHVHLPSARKRLGSWNRLIATAFRVTGAIELGGLSHIDAQANLRGYGDAIDELTEELLQAWTPDPDDRYALWRAPGGVIQDAWRTHAEGNRQLCEGIGKLLASARREVQARLKEEEGGTSPALDKLDRQVGMALEQLREQYALWARWATPDPEGRPPTARWLSVGTDQGLVCSASPILAGPFLEKTLWAQADGAVLTSATLSAGGDFKSLMRELHLPEQAECLSLPSPFDLPALATLQVPAMRSTPDQFDRHVEEIAQWLAAELDWKAGSLTLFTSKRKLDAVHAALRPEHKAKVKVQGSASREQLVADHSRDVSAGTGSVLFGLASMGEGLDLPGALATTVVITQLPFAVHTDPVPATVAEWIEARGGNAFVEMTIPTTIRTLTQYCGRLVRGPEDRGRIVILDRRLAVKRYGATILGALPPFTQSVARGSA